LIEKLKYSLSVTTEAKGHYKDAVLRYQKAVFNYISYRMLYREGEVPECIVLDGSSTNPNDLS